MDGGALTRKHLGQLADMGILPLGEPVERYRQFDELFRSGVYCVSGRLVTGLRCKYNHTCTVWADHADAIAQQYAGTGALKTDVTRMGRRTLRGMVNDLTNSLVRYYKNNFRDGFRQVSLGSFSSLVGARVLIPYPPPP